MISEIGWLDAKGQTRFRALLAELKALLLEHKAQKVQYAEKIYLAKGDGDGKLLKGSFGKSILNIMNPIAKRLMKEATIAFFLSSNSIKNIGTIEAIPKANPAMTPFVILSILTFKFVCRFKPIHNLFVNFTWICNSDYMF